MVGLGSKTLNVLTKFKSNVATKKSNDKKQYIAEVAAASSVTNIVAPKITTNANAQDEVDRHNTARIKAIGIKEGIVAEIMLVVRAQITNPILCTTDGSDFRTVNDYVLHQLLSAVMGGAEQPYSTVIR